MPGQSSPSPRTEPSRPTWSLNAIPPGETVETHTAILTFAGDRVYKRKKALNLGFLDFREREARLAACEAEVALNSRLAPDVYLGVADLRDATGQLIDHLVVMRRLPEDRRLATLVRHGEPVGDVLRAIARQLAAFHETCETSDEIAQAGSRSTLSGLWREGVEGVASFRDDILDDAVIDEIDRLSSRYLAGRGALLLERMRSGRVRDGHGDLLADDIFCLTDGPRILDCLDFDQRLRVGDVLGDAAFLAMDLERLGAGGDAQRFLGWYREFSGETHPSSLEHLYIAYRAFVRAKVSSVRAAQGDPDAADLARQFGTLALDHLRRGRVRLVIVGGLPGTGKTTLAGHLADAEDGWVLLRSDVVRKELAGLPTNAPAPPELAGLGTGIYAHETTDAVYTELLRRAGHALAHGENVLLDASWSATTQRTAAARVAAAASADLVELCCVTSSAVAEARIARRAAAGSDASDATSMAVYTAMASRTDPWPAAAVVDTAVPLAEAAATASRLLR
ncbi:AAA family ATPase [Frankia sp. AgB1.9]|uniref:bifunctional aminoglycoside phosphotransferase/ATP-binding protein n=1 Tax=unclassified Frankia TaxID=2632575 RepID=UPI001932A0CA|nr:MULTISPECIES: AAA family ATPase [unclassified Frankia]MBL7488026.1 AAA family ATPase [Frankia sp. AgW1.1]MBL7549464.1 AAA family ATPase [Frankia sp. AgB1.9]MBL7619920.1 AAA family ATPase [Frankia sp. AgB1.8]